LHDFIEGVLEGLAYALKVTKSGKASQKIRQQILRIVEAQAKDFEYRI